MSTRARRSLWQLDQTSDPLFAVATICAGVAATAALAFALYAADVFWIRSPLI